MTESTTISLEEVRSRFLEAEARLGDAANAIQSIEDAATRIGAARESLTTAGDEIRGLAGQFGEVASSLSENAEELRRGVDAIRLGDPAAVRRQIEELDATFTAHQSVLAERFERLESAQTALRDQLTSSASAADSRMGRAQLEGRILFGVVVLMLAGVLTLLIVR